jgi:hypothetical protein
LITRYIQNYINKNRKYPDILEIYKNIYNDQLVHDSEIANKLQFIEDSKISAYTSADGDTKDLYPIYEEFAIEEEKKQQEMAALKGITTGIDFGSQIRSYVLEPYTLVKDTRSNFEMNDAEKVLDGEVKPFIESILKMN